MENETNNKTYLVLEDGTVFSGFCMGKVGETIGEVVFNTCIASYSDILSDPAYYGQIVAQTYPLVGNRGIENSTLSSNVTANGYIAREWCEKPTDVRGGMTIDEYLKKKNIVGICGIDTRQLTRRIRNEAYFKGAITTTIDDMAGLIDRIKSYSIHGAVSGVTLHETITLNSSCSVYSLVIFDYGFHRSITKAFLNRKCCLHIVPADTAPEAILEMKPDGLIFPDGPGDPDDNPVLIENIKRLLKFNIPFYGYGLGHQMIALAVGGTIQKMQKGHRGSSQPVMVCGTERIMITTQNHGYDVADGSISKDIGNVTMRNINDGSVEGISYSAIKGISTQFTPVDFENYSDSAWIFNEFIKLLEGDCDNA